MAGEYLTGRVVHIDQPLSNVAINYRPSGFIGDQVSLWCRCKSNPICM